MNKKSGEMFEEGGKREIPSEEIKRDREPYVGQGEVESWPEEMTEALFKGQVEKKTLPEVVEKEPPRIRGIKRKLAKGELISKRETAVLREFELYGKERVVKAEAEEPPPEPALAGQETAEISRELPVESKEAIPAEPEVAAAEKPEPPKGFARIIPAEEKGSVEVKKEEIEKEEKITPEEEKIGEREFNLKNSYVELFKDLQKGLQPSQDIYETIEEDKNKLAEFYGPQVKEKVGFLFERLKIKPKKEQPKEKLDFDSGELKRLYFELLKYKKNKEKPPQEILDKIKSQEDKIYERELRKEVGPIFDKIKIEAMEEAGYRPTEKKKIKERERIMEGERLLKKYGIETLEQLEELEKQLKKETEK